MAASLKKLEIAAKVFATLEAVPLADLRDGPLVLPFADLAGLALIPWYCDESIQ